MQRLPLSVCARGFLKLTLETWRVSPAQMKEQRRLLVARGFAGSSATDVPATAAGRTRAHLRAPEGAGGGSTSPAPRLP